MAGGAGNERDPVIIDRHIVNEQANRQEGQWDDDQGQTSELERCPYMCFRPAARHARAPRMAKSLVPGSSPISVHKHGENFHAARRRFRSRSYLARPYICRFNTFSLLICPSTGLGAPRLSQGCPHGGVIAFQPLGEGSQFSFAVLRRAKRQTLWDAPSLSMVSSRLANSAASASFGAATAR